MRQCSGHNPVTNVPIVESGALYRLAETGLSTNKNSDAMKAPLLSFVYFGPNKSPVGYLLAAPQTVSMMSRVTTYGSQLAFGRRSSM